MREVWPIYKWPPFKVDAYWSKRLDWGFEAGRRDRADRDAQAALARRVCGMLDRIFGPSGEEGRNG